MKAGFLSAALLALAPALASAADPVKVFILMGQSNMLGEGDIKPQQKSPGVSLQEAVTKQGLYPYLWDAKSKTWTTSDHVRNVALMGSGNKTTFPTTHNEFMTVKGVTIGPELGIGYELGQYISSPVMTLKSCIGNRALGWDLLPPTSERYDYTDSQGQSWTYGGYHDAHNKWPKGTDPPPNNKWFAGAQYDGDIRRADTVLANISQYYPNASSYEVAGIFWWQGDRDRYDEGNAVHYEEHLVTLIEQLRLHFKAPNAPFVAGTLGQDMLNATGNDGYILNATLAVDGNSGKYPQYKGNVKVVYTHPLMVTPSASNAHYGHDARTYMNVGQAMGSAMVDLLKGQK